MERDEENLARRSFINLKPTVFNFQFNDNILRLEKCEKNLIKFLLIKTLYKLMSKEDF